MNQSGVGQNVWASLELGAYAARVSSCCPKMTHKRQPFACLKTGEHVLRAGVL
jgi:hypothetical protein